MGKKRERDDEPDDRPQKSSLMDMLAMVAGIADSGILDAVVAAAMASNPKEEEAKGTSESKQCVHARIDTPQKKMVRSSLLSSGSGLCELCTRPVPGSAILVCIECGRHFCSGVGSVEYPYGHSREHANKCGHWVAAQYNAPESAFCFECDHEVETRGKSEAGGHAFGLTDADHEALRWLAKTDDGRDRAPPPGISNLGTGEPCNHVPSDSARIEMLNSSLQSAEGGVCELCPNPIVGSSILVCMDCGRHLCSGEGSPDFPYGHSRLHAMQEQHWVAAQYFEPESAFCFKCQYVVCVTPDAEVDEMMDKADASGHASGLVGKVEASGHVSRLAYNPIIVTRALFNALRSVNWHGYAIRGIPNLGNTCYMNAMVQCLLMLDKLRARMLAPDAPQGLLSTSLRDLFVATTALGGILDPNKLFQSVCLHVSKYRAKGMEDSHELLMDLRNSMDKEEKIANPNRQSDAPTVMDSIFKFQVLEAKYCKRCLSNSGTHQPYFELSLALPSERHPAKSAASPQPSESFKSQPKKITMQLFPANDKCNLGKIQTVAESGDPHPLGSELKDVAVEGTSEPLEVDSTEVQHICQSKDVVDKVSCPELSQRIVKVPVKSVGFLPHNLFDVKVDEMTETTADSVASIEDCLSLYFEGEVPDFRCDNCAKVNDEEPSTSQSKHGERVVTITTKNTTVDGDQTEQPDKTICQNEQSIGSDSFSEECKTSSSSQPHDFDAQGQVIKTVDRTIEGTDLGMSCDKKDSAACSTTSKEAECDKGTLEAVTSCLPAEKQTILLRTQQSGDLCPQIKMYQDMTKQSKDNKNEQKDGKGGAIERNFITKLPPVLTIQLRRGTNELKKNSDRVSYEEYLDVGPFVDPRFWSPQVTPRMTLVLYVDNALVSTGLRTNVSTHDTASSHKVTGTCQNRNAFHKCGEWATGISYFDDKLVELGSMFELCKGIVQTQYITCLRKVSVDKSNTIYRLVGVVEHRGEHLRAGHYVAYVRARKLENCQRQGSCSYSWFYADDSVITVVSLEEVLKREAYVLFYERVEG
ncbi:hypothetical protein ACP4OV_005419 [Aristida adscensionis]